MSTMWLIASREFRTRTMAKANIIASVAIFVVLVAGALILKPILAADDHEARIIEVDRATAAQLIPHLEATALAGRLEFAFVEVDAPAEPAVSPDALALIVGPAEAPRVYLESEQPDIVSVTQGAVHALVLDEQVSALEGDPREFTRALAQAVPTVTILGEVDDFEPGAFFAGLVLNFVLLFILIQSASVTMMGVVEEKVSRVVEILLATVRPSVLLGGKILGVGLYSLQQAVVMLVPLLFAAWHLDLVQYLDVGVGALLVNFGVWFLLGFALFTIFFGGLAALVSRQEDIGSISTPMLLLVMAPFYLGVYLVPSNPDGAAAAVLTQIPFFAPFMVPMRSAFGAITAWETALAIALCLITIPVLVWLAGRVYAGAVLNTGGRMKVRDALRRA